MLNENYEVQDCFKPECDALLTVTMRNSEGGVYVLRTGDRMGNVSAAVDTVAIQFCDAGHVRTY
jgi:hypothetical protein